MAASKQIARVPVTREPYAAVATPDGKTVFVANHLPLDRADGSEVAANVSGIDTATNRVTAIRLPNGSSSVRGMCRLARRPLRLRGTRALALSNARHATGSRLDQYQRHEHHRRRGPAACSTVLLDDIDQGAALPWGVATSGDGRTIFVTHAGTHELSRIDAAGPDGQAWWRLEIRAASAPKRSTIWLHGARAAAVRLPATVRAAWPWRASESTWQSISAIRWAWWISIPSKPVAAAQIALGPPPRLTPERRGEMLFHDATICFQHWQACASCHPDARVDGLNWDLLNDGLAIRRTRGACCTSITAGRPCRWASAKAPRKQ